MKKFSALVLISISLGCLAVKAATLSNLVNLGQYQVIQSGGSNAFVINLNSNSTFVIRDDGGNQIFGLNPIVSASPNVGRPYKWNFTVGAPSNVTNLISDINFNMEQGYFWAFNENKNTTFLRFNGGGTGNGGSFGFVQGGDTSGNDLNIWTLWDYRGNFFPLHLYSQQDPTALLAPTVSKTANIGSTGTASNLGTDTDVATRITVTPGGTGISAGDIFTNSFVSNYTVLPHVVWSESNTNAALTRGYIDSVTVSNFIFATTNVLGAGLVYKWDFMVIQ